MWLAVVAPQVLAWLVQVVLPLVSRSRMGVPTRSVMMAANSAHLQLARYAPLLQKSPMIVLLIARELQSPRR